MPYVQRTGAVVTGIYATPQYDSDEARTPLATEWLDDDDAEVTAFLASAEPPAPLAQDATQKLVAFLSANPDVKALLGL